MGGEHRGRRGRVRALDEQIGRGGPHEVVAGALEEQPAARQDAQDAGGAVDLVQQMGGDHDGDAVGCEIAQESTGLLDARRVEAVGGLVEDEQGGTAHQRHGDAQALLHSQGVLADPLVHLLVHVHGAHRAAHVLLAQVEESLHDAHVLRSGQVPVAGRRLDERADAGELVPSGRAGHGLALDEDLAVGGLHERQEHLHGGGLPRAIGAEESVDGALRDAQIQSVDDGPVAVPLGQISGFDDVCHAFECCRSGAAPPRAAGPPGCMHLAYALSGALRTAHSGGSPGRPSTGWCVRGLPEAAQRSPGRMSPLS